MKRGCLWGIALLLFPFFYVTALVVVYNVTQLAMERLVWN